MKGVAIGAERGIVVGLSSFSRRCQIEDVGSGGCRWMSFDGLIAGGEEGRGRSETYNLGVIEKLQSFGVTRRKDLGHGTNNKGIRAKFQSALRRTISIFIRICLVLPPVNEPRRRRQGTTIQSRSLT